MARELVIAGRRIADDTDPFVICEIGSNHGGSVDLCKRLIRVAAECGCDAVKLQKRDNQNLYTKAMLDAPYDSQHAYGPTYGAHREALEFGMDVWQELQEYAHSLGLVFLATAFDIPSADNLARLGVPAIKIASGDLLNRPLLEHCAGLGLPLLVSTGGHAIAAVERAVYWLERAGASFALLQATASYPTPHEELNLRVIETYRERYPHTVIGISDHNDGISMAPVAWMLGARIFEKHFTLSRAAKGSDNHFSLEPEAMRHMVNDLRGVALALGDGVKEPYLSEAAAMAKMGKSLVATRDMHVGNTLIAEDIAIKSPGGGMAPYRIDELIGQVLTLPTWTDFPFSPGHIRVRSSW